MRDELELLQVEALMVPGLDLPDLAAMLDRPSWMYRAACRGQSPEVNFFPARGEDVRPAKQVCASCLVRAECLDFALEHDETAAGVPRGFGVWGGMSALQRVRLRRGEDVGASEQPANSAKTHCPAGHAYDEQNTVVTAGRRTCRICRRAATERYYARKRNAA